VHSSKGGVSLKGITVKSRRETWIKPEVEIVDLCTEVTLYLYNRR
jgi:coenzyme PQQ precursor peptide PqqA